MKAITCEIDIKASQGTEISRTFNCVGGGGGWNGWCYNLEIKKRYSLWKYISKRIHAITPEFQREATIEWGPI